MSLGWDLYLFCLRSLESVCHHKIYAINLYGFFFFIKNLLLYKVELSEY